MISATRPVVIQEFNNVNYLQYIHYDVCIDNGGCPDNINTIIESLKAPQKPLLIITEKTGPLKVLFENDDDPLNLCYFCLNINRRTKVQWNVGTYKPKLVFFDFVKPRDSGPKKMELDEEYEVEEKEE